MGEEEPKKNLWVWLLIFLAVVVLIYSLVYFFVIAKQKETIPAQPPITEEPSLTPTAIPTETFLPTATPTTPFLLSLPKTGVE